MAPLRQHTCQHASVWAGAIIVGVSAVLYARLIAAAFTKSGVPARAVDAFDAGLITDDRFGGLLLSKEKLARSNEHYRRIHPSEAAAVDAHLAEEKARAEAKVKAAAEARAKTIPKDQPA